MNAAISQCGGLPQDLAVRIFAVLALLSACAPEARVPTINQAPLPSLALPPTATVGESVSIDGNASRDIDGIVSDAYILFGDGSDPVVGLTADHAWEAPGQYLVELYVEDDAGATARARARITIE